LSSAIQLDSEELRFSNANPPEFVVHVDDPTALKDSDVQTPDKDAVADFEGRWEIVEAYRAMYRSYGTALLFSKPRLSHSLVYRSEREFHEKYDNRFCWLLHFYEAYWCEETKTYESKRYAGMLFVKPKEVHIESLREEGKEKKAEDHLEVQPAVCEGYLRPPEGLSLSPHVLHCIGDYAHPYGELPFQGIPFTSTRWGSGCGFNALAPAIMMNKYGVTFSPFELAVLAAEKSHDSKPGTPDSDLHGLCPQEISKLKTNMINHLVNEYCGGHAKNTGYKSGHGAQSITAPHQLRAFSKYLMSYLYQGIPIVMSVDSAKLYPEEDQDSRIPEVPAGESAADGAVEENEQPESTDESTAHFVLIHGMVLMGDDIPEVIISDSTDLHKTGNVFLQVSCEQLLECRTIKQEDYKKLQMLELDELPELKEAIQDRSKRHTNYIVPLIVPSPQGLESTHNDASLLLKRIITRNSPVYGILNLVLEAHFKGNENLLQMMSPPVVEQKSFLSKPLSVLSKIFGSADDGTASTANADEFEKLYLGDALGNFQMTLRNISQWSGFMLRRAFGTDVEHKNNHIFQKIIDDFRNWIRDQDLPEYMWICDAPDKSCGVALGTTKEFPEITHDGKFEFKGSGGVFIEDKLCLLYAPETKNAQSKRSVKYYLAYKTLEGELIHEEGEATAE